MTNAASLCRNGYLQQKKTNKQYVAENITDDDFKIVSVFWILIISAQLIVMMYFFAKILRIFLHFDTFRFSQVLF